MSPLFLLNLKTRDGIRQKIDELRISDYWKILQIQILRILKGADFPSYIL